MNKQLGIEINIKSLLRFTAPGILLMIFLSSYIMVDGIFISNFVGTDGMAAINIVYPMINIITAIGVMFGTGGSALCGINIGKGKLCEARQDFTFLNILGLIIGVVFAFVIILFIKPIIFGLGGTEKIYSLCYDYLVISMYFAPFFILQYTYQYLLITAGEPKYAMFSTIIGGTINIALDYLLIVDFDMGMLGAALATGIGSLFAALFGFGCFVFSKKLALRYNRPRQRVKSFFKQRLKQTVSACVNGSSEMVINLASGIRTFAFNIIALKLAGEDGIASIAAILYIQYILNAINAGYISAAAPLISYNYGAKRENEIKKIFRYSIGFVFISSITIACFAFFGANILSLVFFGSEVDAVSYALTFDGMKYFALAFVFSGINIFTSGMFAAFANGKVAASLSFLRTFIFIVAYLLILPEFMGITGMWLAIPFAEVSSFLFSILLLKKYAKIYNY